MRYLFQKKKAYSKGLKAFLPLYLILIFSISLSLFAEKSYEFHLWPLIDIDREETDVVWPFIFRYNNDADFSYGIRPLFSCYDNREKNVKGMDFVWPFVYQKLKYDTDSAESKNYFQITPLTYYEKKIIDKDEEQKFILFPFVYQGTMKRENASNEIEKSSNFVFFPFIWYNNGMQRFFPIRWDKGKFFAFFPLFGSFKNMMARDKISFLLWPLFIMANTGNSYTYHLIFPILSFTYGDEKGLKIFPLFRYKLKENDYFKSYYLWPLSHIHKTALNSPSPNYLTMLFPIFWILKQGEIHNLNIFPFYWKYDSPNYKSRGYLYPIFFMKEDKKEKYKEIKLFRLYSKRWGESENKSHQFFPLKGSIKKEGKSQFYFLWPLCQHNVYNTEERKLKTTLVAPLYYHKHSKRYADNSEEKSTIIFPLYYSNTKSNNVKKKAILWPPLFYEKIDGFERNWYAFFSFFNYYSDKEGNKKISILHKLFRKVNRANGEKYMEFNPFVFHLKLGNKEKEFSLLGWLFSYRKTEAHSYFRFLYIPYEFEN